MPRYRSGYSRFVRYAKLGLPVIAASIVLLLVIWPEFRTDTPRFEIRTGDASFTVEGVNRATNTRFTGVDNKNRPYSVIADTVVQMDDQAERFEFVNPRATISLAEEGQTSLAASPGLVSAHSTIARTGGWSAHETGKRLRISHRESPVQPEVGEAQIETPVTGDGEFGKIDALGSDRP